MTHLSSLTALAGFTVYYGIKLLTLYATGFLILPTLTISTICNNILNGNNHKPLLAVIVTLANMVLLRQIQDHIRECYY